MEHSSNRPAGKPAQPLGTPEEPCRPAWRTALRNHWLALAAYAAYAGRWMQYVLEARAYHAQPEPGGTGDSLNWLLGQVEIAILFVIVLLANAAWRKQGRRFYLVMSGLVLVPFLLQFFIAG